MQGWIFGVWCHGRSHVLVIGIRPVTRSCSRTFQCPKFGKLTTARCPIRNICRNTARGRSTEIGHFLHEPEKTSLAEALTEALRQYRSPVFDNPQNR